MLFNGLVPFGSKILWIAELSGSTTNKQILNFLIFIREQLNCLNAIRKPYHVGASAKLNPHQFPSSHVLGVHSTTVLPWWAVGCTHNQVRASVHSCTRRWKWSHIRNINHCTLKSNSRPHRWGSVFKLRGSYISYGHMISVNIKHRTVLQS